MSTSPPPLNNFFFFFFLLTVVVADLSSDKQALLDFAASVPHSRSKKLNWNSNSNSSSLCTSWSGVTCDSNHLRVVELRLPAAGFYGSIPPNTLARLDSLSSLSLRSNLLSGPLPPDLLSLPSLRYLYFQNNNFSGTIPSNLSQHLTFLDLSFNSFTGDLPPALTRLTRLVALNLQNNSLSGPIPDLLLSSTQLQQLNLTNNNFNGSIPTSLQRFPASSFLGNSLLCGTPLPNQCPNNSPLSPSPSPSPSPPFFPQSPPPSTPPLPSSPAPAAITSHKAKVEDTPKYSKSKLTTGSAVGIAVASSAVLLLLFLLCGILWRRRRTKKREAVTSSSKASFGFEQVGRRNENNKLVFLSPSSLDIIINFDLDDLLRASAEVLGKGAYGTTYKAKLQQEGGGGEGTTRTVVAVKRLKQVVVGEMVFQQHMENLGRVNHHPNVLPLRAYYYSKDEKLLVYDYAPFGNLSTLLHGYGNSTRTLDWESRLKICVGAARGIAHIHSAAAGRLIHGNIKSSNVLLLTRDLTGCISDFGITPLVGLFTAPSRKTGYQAPEVTELGKYTQKSDVYSFGVILLEILTGKPPIQTPPLVDKAVDLPSWVQSVVREEWTAEVFDTELIKRNPDAQEEMVQMLQVALACAARLPETRPKMEQVVEMIQQILQPQFHIGG